eukprot:CAMPEP_0114452740 /NCGR_PEP_ID=MMETSP0104-20121206/1676_1 /TAXON_ID=37642 ORGANISM="Paraphysomonas imperforata, Strain PA2" /NCGR_SAMPLE_ID=MMETSP0104 /ASSEMBLY_ACC=CAM_ASM_000202 /LENGTH=189 /DNA_ID=CAMNT_0001625011 /DNA_START=674 /DNA_END=1240 /DNA_ORIENTATION=-
MSGNQLRLFHVRDSSNRGPLVFRGHMMRALGFLDELNWLNGNDDHDIHIRAYVHERWVTGFYELPFEHLVRNKVAEAQRTAELIAHHDRANGTAQNTTTFTPTAHSGIQQQVVDSFIQHRDGGYTSWKYKKQAILHRNNSFYRDIFLSKRLVPHQPHLRMKGQFAAHSAHLPIRENTRVLSDEMLHEAW